MPARWYLLFVLLVACWGSSARAEQPPLFDRQNLVAWCIVPFDAARRSPEERAKMLDELGLHQLAYDWRDEHIPQFDEEVAACARHNVRIVAWWMAGADLNDTNRKILDVVRRQKLKMQFWVLVGDPDPKLPQAERVRVCAEAIRPLAVEAARLDCQVGLYNHGGWFGEPENQLAILKAIDLPNVGLVYNLHHGHGHLDRFAGLLAQIKPHLLALNINGMNPRGDEQGEKILPVGAGQLDLELLRTIRDSGYAGPIGVLNHTDLDARARLADNLAGIDWLAKQLRGETAGPFPKMETYSPPVPAPAAPTIAVPPTAPPSEPQSRADEATIEHLVAEAAEQGDAARGAAAFASAKFACLTCHRVGTDGAAIGPELTRIGIDRCAEELAESLLWPQRRVRPEYVAWSLVTDDGTVHQGYLAGEDGQHVKLRESSSGQVVSLAKSAIEERLQIGTLMPEGLAAAMSAGERRDVLRFLIELGREGIDSTRLLAEHSAATSFPYEFAPLEPGQWRHAGERVNRDRLYDFYAKEADYFRDVRPQPRILPAYPGLDGGRYGHWGNQDEAFWRDGRWNAMDCGTVRCGIVQVSDPPVARGICVRLPGPERLSTCFDPSTLTYRAVWQGDFVKYSAVRHGFVEGLTPAGAPVVFDGGTTPTAPFHYRGYYRSGEQVIFSYDIGGRHFLDAPLVEAGRFKRLVAPADEHPLRDRLNGGPALWGVALETKGQLGAGQGYVVDTISAPMQNPWNALFFFGGHDFLPDGSAMVCTMHGDVWHVSGIDDKLEQIRWKRFASGLHHPQGLVVADGQIYVLGRNQITRLHDTNGDDEADFYECFSTALETSTAGHDFICGLERDSSGAFYTASGNQGLLRISPDGTRAEVLATGFRNPDGLGLLPDGSITVPCSEGEWTATSMICLVRPSRAAESAAPPPHFGYRGPHGGVAPELPLVYLPRGVDNSSGGQTYVSSKQWGPTAGAMVHLSFGAGTYFLLLRDEVRGQSQGAIIPMPGDFASGPHRGRFHPLDGQFYVTGMNGWGTYTHADGSFERVRYTGEPVQLPTGFHVYENGILLSFAAPVDRAVAGDASRQFAQAWNYRYSSAYGSAEYSPSHAGAVGHDRLPVAGAHVLGDGHSVFLELPDLQPTNQLHLRVQVGASDPQDLFLTVHSLDAPFTGFDSYQPREKTIAAHPLLADLAALAHPPEPNPWRSPLPNARAMLVEAGKNLTFATRTITARPGEAIALTLKNPDVVPHNWVLIKPGALARVGAAVNRLVADPEAARRQYAPVSDDVLSYTDITTPGDSTTIHFIAPDTPGRYPYLCSFPGHWMVMNGQLIVE